MEAILKIEKLEKIWNSGRKIEGRQAHYTTGQIAKIFGIRNARRIAGWIDEGKIRGRTVNGSEGRGLRSYRVVCHTALVEFIEQNGNIYARKWLLGQRREAFERIVSRESVRGGVLSGFGELANCLKKVVRNLDPLDELAGASEDRKRIKVFEHLVRLMSSHIDVRVAIAKSKNRKKN